MQIEIHIPRPGQTLLIIAAVSGWLVALNPFGSSSTASVTPVPSQAPVVVQEVVRGQPVGYSEQVEHSHEDVDVTAGNTPAIEQKTTVSALARGGDDTSATLRQNMAEWRVLQAREEQQVLLNKQQIVRAQLEALQNQRRELGSQIDPALEEKFAQGVRMLVGLLDDEKRSSDFLRTAMGQVWEAQGKVVALATGDPAHILLTWPVVPLQGISAHFLDQDYKKIFKMEHYAIDIPTPQGSPVRAAADGTIRDVKDHGLGFNYITIEHDDGTVTLYGHLSAFRVKSGDRVFAGTVIGDSGGMPGTKGAGMSTGPHVHFGLFVKGTPVDPLPYLPKQS